MLFVLCDVMKVSVFGCGCVMLKWCVSVLLSWILLMFGIDMGVLVFSVVMDSSLLISFG